MFYSFTCACGIWLCFLAIRPTPVFQLLPLLVSVILLPGEGRETCSLWGLHPPVKGSNSVTRTPEHA